MSIAVITGASSGLGVKFLDAMIRKYPAWPFLLHGFPDAPQAPAK